MKGWNNLRIAAKLIGSFALVAVLAGAIGAVGIQGLHTLQDRVRWNTQVAAPGLVDLLEVQSNINFGIRATRGVILASTTAKIADVSGDARSAWTAMQYYLQRYRALPALRACSFNGILRFESPGSLWSDSDIKHLT